MQGYDLAQVICDDRPIREYALFGMHGAHICITDGDYVYMRADRPGTELYDYTLLPLHQHAMYAPEELRQAELVPPFAFTKGCPLLQIALPKGFYPYMSCMESPNDDFLFNLVNDPGQLRPISDGPQELRLQRALVRLMEENDAPPEQYVRVGLEHLRQTV